MELNTVTHNQVKFAILKQVPKDPKRTEDSIPDESSEDFRAKDQPAGVIDAQ